MLSLPQLTIRRFSSLYLRIAENVSSVSIEGFEEYGRSLEGYKSGRHNLIIPFRHVSKADAPVLAALFGRLLPRMMKKGPLYCWVHFLFGDMVLDWAGSGARWLFPRIGAVPVSNKKVIREQVERIREIVTGRHWPLCMAPEGQVNYYNEKPGDYTGGLTHFIRWSQHEKKDIVIQPVRIRYIYKKDVSLQKNLVSRFNSLGISLESSGHMEDFLDEAVVNLLKFLLDYLSEHSPWADQIFECDDELLPAVRGILIESAEIPYSVRSGRRPLDQVLMFRNGVFEDLRKSGITVPKMMKLIGERWRKPSTMSDLMRLYQHQQLLDVLTNFDCAYHRGGDENRQIEQTLFLLDIINRLKGGDVNSRHFPGGTKAVIRFGEPMLFRPEDDPSRWQSIL